MHGAAEGKLFLPSLAQTGLELKQVFEPEFHLLSRSSQLGLTGATVSGRAFESFSLHMALSLNCTVGRSKEELLGLAYCRDLNGTDLRTQTQLYSNPFSKFIPSAGTCRKLGIELCSVKGERLPDLLSMKLCFTLPGANVTPELGCGTERWRFKVDSLSVKFSWISKNITKNL